MKTKLRLSCALVAALFGTETFISHAQTWNIILPESPPSTSLAGNGNDVIINPFNSTPASSVFLAISSSGSDTTSIFRLTPTDVASTAFNFEEVDDGLQSAAKLAYTPGDGLYAAGYAVVTTGRRNSPSTMCWKVRKSKESDQGNSNTWNDDDSFQFLSAAKNATQPLNSRAMGIATDREGKVTGNAFVSGWASDGKVNHWIIRKKAAAGWATVLDTKAADAYSIPYKMCFVPQGGNNPVPAHFAVGILNDRWTVLRSRDQGTSWSTVGPWPADGSLASAFDVASDSLGNVYVTGVRGRDGYNRGWVLRKSNDGGSNWQTLLDQPSQLDSWVVRIAIDAANNISLAGSIDGANGSPRWAILRNSPGQLWSDSWATVMFPLGPNDSALSKGRGMAVDPVGNLFLTGDVDSSVGLLRLVP